jgi:hypothetical protein
MNGLDEKFNQTIVSQIRTALMKILQIFIIAILCNFAFHSKADETNQISSQKPLGKINLVNVPISEVFRIYAQIAGVQLKFDQQLPSAATNSLINFKTEKPLTRTETIQALEQAFREQAGIVLKPLDTKHVEVTFDESVKAKN